MSLDCVLQCPVCFSPFDDKSHTPFVSACGHSICQECNEKTRPRTCSLCQQSINGMKINYQLRDIVVEYQKTLKTLATKEVLIAAKEAELAAKDIEIVFKELQIAEEQDKLREMTICYDSISRQMEGLTCSDCKIKVIEDRALVCFDCLPPELVAEVEMDSSTFKKIINFEEAEKHIICRDCQYAGHSIHDTTFFFPLKMEEDIEGLKKELLAIFREFECGESDVIHEIDGVFSLAIDNTITNMMNLKSEESKYCKTKLAEFARRYATARHDGLKNLIDSVKAVVDDFFDLDI